MKLLKSLMVVLGLLSLASLATNAYYSDQVTVAGNTITADTWYVPEARLVINEVDYDQPSVDMAEFVELKNTGDTSANLGEYTLELINGASGGASIYQTIALPNVDLAASDYYVICSNSATVANCDLDIISVIQNGPADAVALFKNGTIVDTVSYNGSIIPPYVEGSGVGLIDSSSVAGSISRFPDGTDTNQNNIDFIFGPITPGSSNNISN